MVCSLCFLKMKEEKGIIFCECCGITYNKDEVKMTFAELIEILCNKCVSLNECQVSLQLINGEIKCSMFEERRYSYERELPEMR